MCVWFTDKYTFKKKKIIYIKIAVVPFSFNFFNKGVEQALLYITCCSLIT